MTGLYAESPYPDLEEAFKAAQKVKGWNKFDTIIYMAQRVRMLGVNGKYHKNDSMADPLIDLDKKTTRTSIVIQEMIAEKFYDKIT